MEEEGRTTALHEAVAAGAQRDVERLLLSRQCFLDERNERRQTALHLAVLHGRLDLLDWLLTAGKTLKSHSLDVNAADSNGSSALHLACAAADLSACSVLLAHGSSPFLPCRSGDTPLLLLLRASERLEAGALETLLAVVQTMLEKGVEVSSCNANGDTALHLALRHCHPALLPPLMGLLLQASSAALEVENKAGQSPFAFAVQRGLLAALKIALSHNPSPASAAALLASCTDDRVRSLLQAYVDSHAENPAAAAPSSVISPATTGANSSNTTAGTPPATVLLARTRPGLVTRCRILRQPYPREQFEVKVLVPQILSEAIQVTLTPNMRVGEAIQKLRSLRGLQRHEHLTFGLYLPRQTPDNASPSPSRALSPGRSSGSTQLYLDPDLFLWHYGLSRGDLLSLKKCDEAAERRFVWLKAITKAGGELQKRTIRVESSSTVDSLADVVGRQFLTISNQFTGLFLHNDNRSGVWLEPGLTLADYAVSSMDIVELREKPVYKLGFVDGDDSGEIVCDNDTLVGDFTKMVTCWIVAPVDDPRLVGLLHVRQTSPEETEQVWLDPAEKFGSYGLTVGAQLSCFSRKGDPNSQQIARLEVRRDPAACLADTQPKLSAVVKDLPLLPGEEFVDEVCDVNCLGVGASVSDGYLFVTNAHLIFGKRMRFFVDYSAQIPLGSISRLEKVNSSEKVYLDVACKDMRSIRFDFCGPEAKDNRKAIYWHVLSLAFPKHLHQLFAFHHRPKDVAMGAGWSNYSLETEFKRMNVSSQLWRISDINADYSLSPTYPARLGVPASFSDEQLARAFAFRSKGRIPMLAYYHHNTATITRCSQPKVGMTSNRSAADEGLLDAIRMANKAGGSVLHLFDARPRANALANTALGMGYEKVGGDAYVHCSLEFLNIDNIHVMRDCYNRLQRLCETSGRDDKGFYTALDNTRWLAFVKLLLESSVKIATLVDEGNSVMLHCSDGWDRTAQLSALAQIFLSPFYRTLKGFCVLVEKEWISAGHKFHGRHGHGDNNPSDEQRSPIFLQFLDCVYQCLQQYPCEFEFTEALLLKLLDGLYSCHYGTFLCNNERERLQANLRQTTPSLWAAIETEREKYLNPLYLRGVGVVYPSSSYERLRLWGDYYLRWCRKPSEHSNAVTVELRALQLSEQAKQLQGQVSALQEQVAALEAQLNQQQQPIE